MKTVRTLLVGSVLAVLAPAAAPAAGQHTHREITKRINEAGSRAEIADMMIADTARSSMFRSRAAAGMAHFVRENTGAAADSALDALIRAYEGMTAYNAANPPNKWLINGVRLRYIFGAQNPRGEAYVRKVFETAEPPPLCEPGEWQTRRECLWDPTKTPYCEAGRVLHGEEVDNARGFGRGPEAIVLYVTHRSDSPPEVRDVSEPAARWWSRCWDNRYPG